MSVEDLWWIQGIYMPHIRHCVKYWCLTHCILCVIPLLISTKNSIVGFKSDTCALKYEFEQLAPNLGPLSFHDWSKVSSNVKRRQRHVCNVFPHWIRPCSVIEIKLTRKRDHYHGQINRHPTNDIYGLNIYIYIAALKKNILRNIGKDNIEFTITPNLKERKKWKSSAMCFSLIDICF